MLGCGCLATAPAPTPDTTLARLTGPAALAIASPPIGTIETEQIGATAPPGAPETSACAGFPWWIVAAIFAALWVNERQRSGAA